MKLKALVGSGEKIGLFTLPFLIVGLSLNVLNPALFSVGDPSNVLKVISIVVLFPGIVVWIWSVGLILTKVPQGKLITSGPYAVVKHPLYTGVSLLVLPWLGILFNTWLGLLVGLALYAGARIFATEEEKLLSATFGSTWAKYCHQVYIPWL